MANASPIRGHHHMTLCVGTPQDDYRFHVNALGLRNVKKTVLFDGPVPIYHLYYGNDVGSESSLLTTFPFRADGRKARPGSGQVKTVSLAVNEDAIPYWEKRLPQHGHAVKKIERFGTQRLVFYHPSGIEYELVGSPEDPRKPWVGADVPQECAIYGTYGITVAARDAGEMHSFMDEAMGFTNSGSEKGDTHFHVGKGLPGQVVEVLHTPDLPQGSWTYGEGSVHHVAFDVAGDQAQKEYKDYLEGMGFTDVSDQKNRNYFMSVYFRTPAGALFEAAYTLGDAFLTDETYENLGAVIQLPPWMEEKREEYLSKLEPISE